MICQVEKKKFFVFFQKKSVKNCFSFMIQRVNLVSDGNVTNING